MNLAAVNYHFGSKEQLIEEVFVRRLGPINRERLENLDRLERGAGEEGPTLEQIIEAFLGPPLRMGHEPERGGAVFVRLLGHTISQPDDRIREMFTRQFREVVPRFIAAFRRRIPDLPTAEIFWRFLFLIGSMAHTMALRDDMQRLSGGLCTDSDVESMIRRLVPFLAAGMRAAAPALEGREVS